MNKNKILKLIHQYMFIFFGIVLYDIGFYFFLSPSKIVTGGMSGLAIILEPYLLQIGSWFTTSIFLYIVNGICVSKSNEPLFGYILCIVSSLKNNALIA